MKKIDQIMEQASQSLVRTAYLEAEQLCLEALSLAKTQKDWGYYSRILLPLQETRRQRRMIAADGLIQLGTSETHLQMWKDEKPIGCLVVTTEEDEIEAQNMLQDARSEQRHLEILFAEVNSDATTWTIRMPSQAHIAIALPAPPPTWCDRAFPASQIPETGHNPQANGPAGWFLYASEKLGDAAIEHAIQADTPQESIALLEQALETIGDHELLHQTLMNTIQEAMRSQIL
ncbi:hypothetical protein KS4_24730 [Poriferisphaera corsica]|uniref:Uncharacterized protein n=1 Tax=Poriferisphaera corsica TaxID=2528020 RepID=A0A517YW00_9BACT|nr:hypothetical protein [Poriferisphaera corsica]QDU34404.1 hypothetical protein KS4_24730 [Poriferisphaera corsica]